MPRKVDHDARRRAIADALLRLAAARGLESVSLRQVAAAAGISMGAVQHYFATKDEMVGFAMEHQARRREQRIVARLVAAGRPPTVRELLRVVALEVVPTDADSREDYLAGVTFFVRALREPRMAAVLAEGGTQVNALFAGQLAAAQRDGLLADGIDVEQEAVLLWSLIDAQSTALLLGARTPEQVTASVDHFLDRLFGPAG
ncbi:MAG TPA: TetR family transcriptional regulator C-terminal domain-containing protein [Pseudonocardia sp.]|nr:TetR family transcriptional regulator C-terminal domain-containing protein [Pseudonocardia sp.]